LVNTGLLAALAGLQFNGGNLSTPNSPSGSNSNNSSTGTTASVSVSDISKKIKCSSTVACFHVQQFTKSFELDDC
jgi:hypothetical protein